MILTGVRMASIAWAISQGTMPSRGTVEHLIEDALRTTQYARRMAPYYSFLPEGEITTESIQTVPITIRRHLLASPQAFLARGVHPFFSARSTGTIRIPVEVWYSREEIAGYAGLTALTALLSQERSPHALCHLHLPLHAVTTLCHLEIAHRLRSQLRLLGNSDPLGSLRLLLVQEQPQTPTELMVSASYLGGLVKCASQLGIGPGDTRLRTISCGGEILSAALREATEQAFGVRPTDTYGMTEMLPVAGIVCRQGHCHFPWTSGLVEVIDRSTGKLARPGELGTLVSLRITPTGHACRLYAMIRATLYGRSRPPRFPANWRRCLRHPFPWANSSI